jgi:hypothetical protein
MWIPYEGDCSNVRDQRPRTVPRPPNVVNSFVDIKIDPAQLELSDADQAEIDAHPALARNVEVLRQWAGRKPTGAARRLHLHFWSKPVEILDIDGHMSAVRFRSTQRRAPSRTPKAG